MTDADVRDWHVRHPDFESFDRITLEVEPRWKTSGLSGDEWRFSVKVSFWFKGEVVHEHHNGNMRSAILMLGAAFLDRQSPIPDRVLALEEAGLCDQPACCLRATARYYLKEHFASNGDRLDQSDRQWARHYRQFCDLHATRGDCSRSDSDANYTRVPTEVK
jgi:hypothetical protein